MSTSFWFMISYSATLLVFGLVAYFWKVRPARLQRTRTCEPNVLVGYADPADRTKTITRVEQWSCGDSVCRCGGTKQRGFLDR